MSSEQVAWAPDPPAASATPDSGRARRGGVWIGIVIVLAALGGAIVTVLLQANAYESTIRQLVRAVPGYRTELDFERSGRFTLYYEYAGEVGAVLDGQIEQVVLGAPPDPPPIGVRITDASGADVPIATVLNGVRYDVGGFQGVAAFSVDIPAAGRHVLEIDESPDGAAFALAVGKGTVAEPTLVVPVIIALSGLALGMIIIVLSLARSRSKPQPAGAPDAAGPSPAPGPPMVGAPSSPGTAPGGWAPPPGSGGVPPAAVPPPAAAPPPRSPWGPPPPPPPG